MRAIAIALAAVGVWLACAVYVARAYNRWRRPTDELEEMYHAPSAKSRYDYPPIREES